MRINIPSLKSLLTTGLALLLAVTLVTPFIHPDVAEASCTGSTTVNCNGITPNGYSNPSGLSSTVNVLNGATLGGSNNDHLALSLNNGNDTLNNNGLITTTGYSTGTGVNGGTGNDTLNNYATILVTGSTRYGGSDTSAIGIIDTSGQNTIYNAVTGVINVSATDQLLFGSEVHDLHSEHDDDHEHDSDQASAIGIVAAGNSTTITNDGSIYANADANNHHNTASAIGIKANGNTLNILNNGLIQTSAQSDDSDNGTAIGIQISGTDGQLLNSGLILVGQAADGTPLPTTEAIGISSDGKTFPINSETGVINVNGTQLAVGMQDTGNDSYMGNLGTINTVSADTAIGMLEKQTKGDGYFENLGYITATSDISATGMLGNTDKDNLTIANWAYIGASGEEFSNGLTGISLKGGISVGNLGLLESKSDGLATGIIISGDHSAIVSTTNDGSHVVYTTLTGYTVDYAYAFNNYVIDVGGLSDTDAPFAYGVIGNGDSIFQNFGDVNVHGNIAGNAYVPIGGVGVLINYGNLTSEAHSSTATVYAKDASTVYIENYGTISSTDLDTNTAGDAIVGSPNGDFVYTAGTVNGNIILGSGKDKGADWMEVGGGPVNGMMDGGSWTGVDYHNDTPNNGGDKLTFSIAVESQYYDQVIAEFNNLNPENGTITIQGNTYTFKNFEELRNMLHKVGTTLQDGRIDAWTPTQTITGWCVNDKAAGYSFWNIQDNKGSPLGRVTDAVINSALAQAKAIGKPVLIIQKDGQSVWALPSHELQMHDGNGHYDHVWSPNMCGSHHEH